MQTGLIQEDRLDELCMQAQEEVKSKQFEGIWPLYMLVGMKRLRAGRGRAVRPRGHAKDDGTWIYI